jgi:hypothetical protein
MVKPAATPAFFMAQRFSVGSAKMKKINGEIDEVVGIFSMGTVNFLLVFLYGNNNNCAVHSELTGAIKQKVS